MNPLNSPILFLVTADADRSRTFYQGTLGLEFVADEPFALVFRVGTNPLRIAKVKQVQPASHTVLGWSVADIRGTVQQLRRAGVIFERYEGMTQDEDGVWQSPSGARVAWFRDPDGNVLSLTQSA